MQLLNICTIGIEMFGFGYFLIASVVHLHYCWANPHAVELKRFDRKLSAIAPTEAPIAESITVPVLPADESTESTIVIEAVAAAAPMPSLPHAVESLSTVNWFGTVAPFRRNSQPQYGDMSIRQLKQLARGKVPNYGRLNKQQLVNALSNPA